MMTTDPLMKPLTLDELIALEQFLVSEQTPPDTISSIEMLDGYMTAAIVGPQVFHADDWLSSIWDHEKQLKPIFSSEEEEQHIDELLVRHNNFISRQFSNNPEEFLPLFDRVSYEDGEEKQRAVEEWSMGFIIGMELAYDEWNPLLEDEESAALSIPMFMLSKISEESEKLTEEEISQLTESIAKAVICIEFFWHDNEV